MALDSVIKAILEDGQKEAELIIAEGRKEAERSLAKARSEAEKTMREALEEADRTANRLRVQETARAEIESKKVVLRAQKEFLDEVYGATLERLRESWGRRLIEVLMDRRASEVRGGCVFSNERNKELVERLAAAHGGRFGGVIPCFGGIVIESADGTVRIDYRLETLLRDVWGDSVHEVTSVLWGGEERK